MMTSPMDGDQIAAYEECIKDLRSTNRRYLSALEFIYFWCQRGPPLPLDVNSPRDGETSRARYVLNEIHTIVLKLFECPEVPK